MIYATCGNCGFTIDIFTAEDATNTVREKRLKYLMTRDQICPNCLVAIYHCQKVEAEESAIPILNVAVGDDEKEKVRAFAKERGYATVTEYTLNHYRHPEEAATTPS